MREKLSPFAAAIFCATLSLITIVGNVCLTLFTGATNASVDTAFYSFLPMCFYFVGQFLSDLRKDQIALRTQMEALTAATPKNTAA